jgi:hypothetical protein
MVLPKFIDEVAEPEVVALKTDKGTFYGIKYKTGAAFLGKSLKTADGKPNLLKIKKGVRIGEYTKDGQRTLVAMGAGAEWTAYTPESVSEKVGS